MILELIGLKKPGFWRLFTQMTADFLRLVIKKSALPIYIYIFFFFSYKMRYFFYPILPHAQVVICCLKDWYIMAWENSRHLRRHPTGFQAKWHPSNERRNSILLKRHYQDLGSASDWLKITLSNQTHYPALGSDVSSVWNFCALCSKNHFAWKPVVTWRNVGCSLRLIISS